MVPYIDLYFKEWQDFWICFFYWMEGFVASRGVDVGDGSNRALRLDCSLSICICTLFRRSCKRIYINLKLYFYTSSAQWQEKGALLYLQILIYIRQSTAK